MRFGDVRGRAEDFEAFAEPGFVAEPRMPKRIDLQPDKVEHGLAQLVLSVLELVRQLMEKQAIRRIEGGSLTAMQIEQLGTTLQRLEQKMAELKNHFAIDDLNIDLGPLGNLVDDDLEADATLERRTPPGLSGAADRRPR